MLQLDCILIFTGKVKVVDVLLDPVRSAQPQSFYAAQDVMSVEDAGSIHRPHRSYNCENKRLVMLLVDILLQLTAVSAAITPLPSGFAFRLARLKGQQVLDTHSPSPFGISSVFVKH